MHGRIGALWSRLDNYVCRDFRQRLYLEGDRSGRMLDWLLRRERPIPIILSLRRPTGKKILGQACVNLHLHKHLKAMYTLPKCDNSCQIQEYLDGLRLPRLMDAQIEEIEWEVSLEELQEALGGMASGKSPGSDGLPVEFYLAYSAILLPRLLETLHESPI
ncbi:hypothetical protein NDU88_001716 [Pleurodeles waltl]|uniref:Reverse transcriptase n=1 Tax=Pleurodeles waltl TaxID=8319 RepID=A0AAV7KQ97_PLEWA|nr:hypothetical protein NDU88_001716 [Pleurodeles waltl]